MPDISMCSNNKCPSKFSCYRFTDIPNELWQTYAGFEVEEGQDKCEYFWKNDNYIDNGNIKNNK